MIKIQTIEDPDGFKAWYLDGKLHQEDGPAIEYANGFTKWYLNGENIPCPVVNH